MICSFTVDAQQWWHVPQSWLEWLYNKVFRNESVMDLRPNITRQSCVVRAWVYSWMCKRVQGLREQDRHLALYATSVGEKAISVAGISRISFIHSRSPADAEH
jgi:hypothetical protein